MMNSGRSEGGGGGEGRESEAQYMALVSSCTAKGTVAVRALDSELERWMEEEEDRDESFDAERLVGGWASSGEVLL